MLLESFYQLLHGEEAWQICWLSRGGCGAQLMLEVVGQLQRMFQPDFRLIKKRIEDLIQRDYLERDKDNANQYRYLA